MRTRALELASKHVIKTTKLWVKFSVKFDHGELYEGTVVVMLGSSSICLMEHRARNLLNSTQSRAYWDQCSLFREDDMCPRRYFALRTWRLEGVGVGT
jgi:hypothetical protein